METLEERIANIAAIAPRGPLEAAAVAYIRSMTVTPGLTTDAREQLRAHVGACTALSFIHEYYRARELGIGRPRAKLAAAHLRGDARLWDRVKALKESAHADE